MTTDRTRHRSHPSRRTVVVGTAWAVPAVVVASAAPALAASGPCSADFSRSTACVTVSNGVVGYQIRVCATPTGSCNPTTLRVQTITQNTPGSPVLTVNQGTGFVGSGTVCLAGLFFYPSLNAAIPGFTIRYSIFNVDMVGSFANGTVVTC